MSYIAFNVLRRIIFRFIRYIKRNLTHKILPIFAIFLFVFYIFMNNYSFATEEESSVIALSGNFSTDLQEIDEYKTGNYYYYGFVFSGTIYVVFIEKDLDPKCFCNVQSLGFDNTYSFIGYKGSGSTGDIYFDSRYTGTIKNQAISYTSVYNKPYLSTNSTIYTDNTYTTIFYSPSDAAVDTFKEPYIADTDESLSQVKDYVLIFPGITETGIIRENVDFIIYKKITITTDSVDSDTGENISYDRLEPLFNTTLKFGSEYYHSVSNDSGIVEDIWYEIPYDTMGIEFKKGEKYIFSLCYLDNTGQNAYVDREITIGSVTQEDKTQEILNIGFSSVNSKIDETTSKLLEEERKTQEAIQESNETNKNIFERIGEMLSYINPFSENFFIYKTIELLIDMLKSLFIPSDNFFTDWLSDLNEYFGDRFGIIYYPFEVIIDFLTRFIDMCSNVNDSASIHVPDLKFMDVILIHEFTFDFNDLLVNDTLKLIHNMYLVVMDVIFSLMLVNLARKIFSDVFGGHFSDEVIGDVSSGERSYNRYVQYQDNKKRYRKDNGGR